MTIFLFATSLSQTTKNRGNYLRVSARIWPDRLKLSRESYLWARHFFYVYRAASQPSLGQHRLKDKAAYHCQPQGLKLFHNSTLMRWNGSATWNVGRRNVCWRQDSDCAVGVEAANSWQPRAGFAIPSETHWLKLACFFKSKFMGFFFFPYRWKKWFVTIWQQLNMGAKKR